MSFEEALEILKFQYFWEATTIEINSSGERFALVTENGWVYRFSEEDVLSKVADFQQDLFEGAK